MLCVCRNIAGFSVKSPFNLHRIFNMRLFYLGLAWLFFLIGAFGVVLPVVPTTPFMLLALWCFSKSSVRFHNWLYQHKFFGPPLQQWEQHRVIPLPAKIMSVTMMAGSFVYLAFFKQLALVFLVPTALLMLYGLWFILTKPSRQEQMSVNTDISGK